MTIKWINMNLLLTGMLLLFIIQIGASQTKGKIIYRQTLNIDYSFVQEYTLFFNDKVSYYIENQENRTEEREFKKKNGKGQVSNIKEYSSKEEKPDFYYTDLSKGKLIFQKCVVPNEPVVVIDSLITVRWKLSREKKKIGTFECQKAEGEFRGRDYVAWFTADIPAPYGPWKFNGLAGLILEVYEKEYKFHAIAENVVIGNVKETSSQIQFPDTSKAVNLEKYIKMMKNQRRDVVAFLNSRRPKGAPMFKAECEDCGDDSNLEIFKK